MFLHRWIRVRGKLKLLKGQVGRGVTACLNKKKGNKSQENPRGLCWDSRAELRAQSCPKIPARLGAAGKSQDLLLGFWGGGGGGREEGLARLCSCPSSRSRAELLRTSRLCCGAGMMLEKCSWCSAGVSSFCWATSLTGLQKLREIPAWFEREHPESLQCFVFLFKPPLFIFYLIHFIHFLI